MKLSFVVFQEAVSAPGQASNMVHIARAGGDETLTLDSGIVWWQTPKGRRGYPVWNVLSFDPVPEPKKP